MKTYWIYGAVICILFAVAGERGFVAASMFQSAQWSPQGRGVHK